MIASTSLVLTSDNSYVYVPSPWALIAFKRNSADGTLTLVEEYISADGIQGPVGIAAWPIPAASTRREPRITPCPVLQINQFGYRHCSFIDIA